MKCDSEIFIVSQKFAGKRSFFEYPLDSSKLDIFRVGQVANDLIISPASLITTKYVLLPHHRGHVAMPVLHTNEGK